MKRQDNTLNEMHLYTNKMEYLIKLLIWVLSWIGGIYVLRHKTEGVSSAFFVFSLSLLMEFAPKIKGKRRLFTRIIYTVFCFGISAVLVMAALLLLDNNYDPLIHTAMTRISVVILALMILDCLILWFSKDTDNNTTGQVENDSRAAQASVEEFNQRLVSGNLGNINEVK